MYTLYYSPSTASLVVHWLLIELGGPFELALVDFSRKDQHSSAFLALNPNGHVPTLIVDGAPRAECAALLMLLAERHPQANLLPAPGSPTRADFLQVMFFLANTLQPAFRRWFYSDEIAGPDNSQAVQKHARAKIERCWEILDARLADGRSYLIGEQLTVADFLATMLARWSRNMPRMATHWPQLQHYVHRMRQMPSLRAVHVRESLKEWIDG
ncbi:MAG: glutathione S-transferase family protein [Steroidobacteraceae bacterium]